MEPISPAACGASACGIVVLGFVTGLHPVLLLAGAWGGWWAMTYQPPLGTLDRLSRVAISALAAAWCAPLAAAWVASREWMPGTLPIELLQYPTALGIGLLAVDVIGRGVLRIGARRAKELSE